MSTVKPLSSSPPHENVKLSVIDQGFPATPSLPLAYVNAEPPEISTAFANAVDISGGSALTYASGNDGVAGNPWSMTDNLTFSWGGELDNGFTVDMSFLLDNSDGAASQIFDNRSLAIGMGDASPIPIANDLLSKI